MAWGSWEKGKVEPTRGASSCVHACVSVVCVRVCVWYIQLHVHQYKYTCVCVWKKTVLSAQHSMLS